MVQATGGNTINEHGGGLRLSRRGLGIAASVAAALLTTGVIWGSERRQSSNPDSTSTGEGSGGKVDGFSIMPAPIGEQVKINPALQAAVATALGLEEPALLGRIHFTEDNPQAGDSPLSVSWGGEWEHQIDSETKRTVGITVSNRFVSDKDLGDIERIRFAETPQIGNEVWYESALQSVTAVGASTVVVVDIKDTVLNLRTKAFEPYAHGELEKQQTIQFAEAVLGMELRG